MGIDNRGNEQCIFLSLIHIFAQTTVWNPDNQNGTFTNPIMWGDWPDPDLIRVDDKFYLVSTSMH